MYHIPSSTPTALFLFPASHAQIPPLPQFHNARPHTFSPELLPSHPARPPIPQHTPPPPPPPPPPHPHPPPPSPPPPPPPPPPHHPPPPPPPTNPPTPQ